MHGVFLHRLTLQFPVVANYLFFLIFRKKLYMHTLTFLLLFLIALLHRCLRHIIFKYS